MFTFDLIIGAMESLTCSSPQKHSRLGCRREKGFSTMIYCEQELERDFYGSHLREVVRHPIFAALFALGAEIL